MRRLLWILPLLAVATVAAAPTALTPAGAVAVSTLVRSAVDRGDVPGAVVAVVNKDGLIYHEAFGRRSALRTPP